MNDKKYLEIYKLIKNKILAGEYKSRAKLPSKRVMADLYGCSVITIENAYKCLVDEGYAYSEERRGYYVCEIDVYPRNGSGSTYIQKTFAPLEDEKINPGKEFEYSVWFKTIRKVISDKGEKLFIKSPNMGCSALRNAIAEYLARYRGMYANPENIVIGSGSEHLYEIAIRILGTNKVFGIENPSYKQIEAVYKGFFAKIEKLKMSDNGIDSLELVSRKFDVLHVTPFRSYPSGVTADAQKRMEYVKWAMDNEGFIIEDDFNSEFFKPGNPIESLFSLDNNDSVIYINTFSKSISPSIRIGYMIIPDRLLDVYKEKMSVYSCTVPVLDQYVLAEFISSGNFERHLNRLRRKMK